MRRGGGFGIWSVFSFLLLAGSQLCAQSEVVQASRERKEVPWHVMVYLIGDDPDLKSEVLPALRDFKNANPNENLVISIQLDPPGKKPTQRLVKRGHKLEVVQTLGETDSANPDTLASYLQWAHEFRPAEHTMLLMWTHGLGWMGLGADASDSASSISILDFRRVLREFRGLRGGRKLDLLYFDCCLMSCAAVLYELRHDVEIVFGSETMIPALGVSHEALMNTLGNFASIPNYDPQRLMDRFVTTVAMDYDRRDRRKLRGVSTEDGFRGITFGAVELSKLGRLIGLYRETLEMIEELGLLDEYSVRVQRLPMFDEDFVDFGMMIDVAIEVLRMHFPRIGNRFLVLEKRWAQWFALEPEAVEGKPRVGDMIRVARSAYHPVRAIWSLVARRELNSKMRLSGINEVGLGSSIFTDPKYAMHRATYEELELTRDCPQLVRLARSRMAWPLPETSPD